MEIPGTQQDKGVQGKRVQMRNCARKDSPGISQDSAVSDSNLGNRGNFPGHGEKG